jgi:hypothetical protein
LTGVNNKIVKFCKLSMEKWSRQVQLKTKKGLMQSSSTKINRGIFQGDSMSPFIFCITLTPQTHKFNTSKCGYQVQGTER